MAPGNWGKIPCPLNKAACILGKALAAHIKNKVKREKLKAKKRRESGEKETEEPGRVDLLLKKPISAAFLQFLRHSPRPFTAG
jgi:hypothetical protein